MLPIATILDPIIKLGHIPYGEHKSFIKMLLNMLESLCIIEASSSTSIDYLLASASHIGSQHYMRN